jgi:hypothetical protein
MLADVEIFSSFFKNIYSSIRKKFYVLLFIITVLYYIVFFVYKFSS